jgi:hypothetical protein
MKIKFDRNGKNKILRLAAAEMIKKGAPTQYSHWAGWEKTMPINHYRRMKRLMRRLKCNPRTASNLYLQKITVKTNQKSKTK